MDQEELRRMIEQAAKDERASLDLSGKGLVWLPPEIGQLTSLKRLFLTNNQLEGLPHEIGRLTNLTRLVLSNNQLTRLPNEIGQLSSLEGLSLKQQPPY